MDLKITNIIPYPVWVGHRNQMLVKIETNQGVYGWGESGLSGRELAVAGAINHYREFLIGQDPRKIGRIWQEVYRSQYFEGGRVLLAALSAIDIALYDIVGKVMGVPVYQLLGGKQRDIVPCFATTGGATVEELIEKADGFAGVFPGYNLLSILNLIIRLFKKSCYIDPSFLCFLLQNTNTRL